MKKNTKENIIFLSLFVAFWLLSGFFFLKNANADNLVANRKSYTFTSFTTKSFVKKDYQDHLEVAIGDQMPKYQYFQLLYPKIKNYVNFQSAHFLLKQSNSYINLKDIYYYRNYLLYETIQETDLSQTYQPILNKINAIMDNSTAHIYVYYLNGDTNISFE